MSVQVEARSADPEPSTLRGVHRSPQRRDIQGLRALLMAQVLLFHAWTIGSPIGIDSFILISAFLMTSSFVRRSETGHMPFFVERWGNTFKRLLPPLVIVVLGTLGATFMFLPATRWKETTIQAFASLTYWENWRLVDVAADYYANDHGLSSPLQHLWSMSMQGQIFLLWPLLMTLCVLFARKTRTSVRSVVVVAFGAVMVASLLWLLILAPADGSVYFDTRARIWEFAFGSMVAAAAPWLKLGRKASAAFTAIALVVLLVFCLVSIGSYPGPMAFIPMTCVSALMLYVPNLQGRSVERILSIAPLVALGNISYAVYLVHWPIFVIYQAYRGQDDLGFVEGIVLIAISIAVAWVLTVTVDNPLRKLPWTNATTPHKYVVIAISLAIGLFPVAGAYWWIASRSAPVIEAGYDHDLVGTENYTAIPETGPGSSEFPGARILTESLDDPLFIEPPIPSPLADPGYATWPGGCPFDRMNEALPDISQCWTYGDIETADSRVLVGGNSHAEQLLLTQISPLMEANNWAGLTLLRGGCPWTSANADLGITNEEAAEKCKDMNAWMEEQVDSFQPDYAFMVVTTSNTGESKETLVPGIEELVEDLTSRGVVVVGVRDNLRADFDLRECSVDRPADKPYGGCLLKASDYFPQVDPTLELQSIPGFHLIDYRDMYCTDDVCPTIIGNVFVYFDSNHIGGEYAASMAPEFSARVAEKLGLSSQ